MEVILSSDMDSVRMRLSRWLSRRRTMLYTVGVVSTLCCGPTDCVGRVESTYEPAMTKAYLHGRTESIRTVQPESFNFVKVCSPTVPGTYISLTISDLLLRYRQSARQDHIAQIRLQETYSIDERVLEWTRSRSVRDTLGSRTSVRPLAHSIQTPVRNVPADPA